MTNVSVEISPEVFNDVYIPHLDNMARTQILYGGASSGKSVFYTQRDILDLMKGGRNFLVSRQVGRTLRGSVVQEARKVIYEWGLNDLFDINKTDNTITCKNGYQIIFAGLDNVEKLKSITPAKGVFTDIRIDEATETEYRTVKQLRKRQRAGSREITKRLSLSFNPILLSNWIYKEFFEAVAWADDQTEHYTDELSILKTTYKDNRFLTPDDIKDLEDETDKYFYEVYTLGNWGVLGSVIFNNWEVQDLSGMDPQYVNLRFGLDFGYSADPAAVTCSHYDKMRKTIYIFGEMYETGLTNDILAEQATALVSNNRIVCDSAEPKSIAELRKYKVNAVGAKKGKDSVLHGIQWLQQQKIIIDVSCVNTRNEFMQYQWKEGADGIAVSPPKPIDKANHLIDALRYAYEEDMTPRLRIPQSASVDNYLVGEEENKDKDFWSR